MKFLLVLFLFTLSSIAQAQKPAEVVSGPMLGHTELRSTNIWIELKPGFEEATLVYWPKVQSKAGAKKLVLKKNSAAFPNIFKWEVPALDPGATYQYQIVVGKESRVIGAGHFTTQSLWQHRTDPPDFTFLTGSCAYFNEPRFDRPGTPYGKDSSIFESMAEEKDASFMLWLGDNWYTREVDYYSESGLHYRPSKDRSTAILQPFLQSMPHYAIWDDHDYGPNDADKSFILKDVSRNVFMKYWSNPSYGQNGQGIFTKLTFNDVEVFMLDDRWFRSNDDEKDSIGGKPNAGKRMFGEMQMEWLKNAMLQSASNTTIKFRIIATGSQVLSEFSTKDCFAHYQTEFNEMMQFLDDNPINGIVFLTGDRHLASVVKKSRENNYPLYDITASSLTAGLSRRAPGELDSPNLLVRVDDANTYSKISFTGRGLSRKMTVKFLNKKGEQLTEWGVQLSEISK